MRGGLLSALTGVGGCLSKQPSMETLWGFSLFFGLISHLVFANEHRFTLRVDLEEDQIQYSKVSIPRHSSRVYVKISADRSLPEGMAPVILLRYNGLPTLDTNDASYGLGDTEAFELLDSAPSEATLFVGFWGGALPNSYRHFAGKARSVPVTMDALIFSCESEVLSGNDCSEELMIIGVSAGGTETTMKMEEGTWMKRGTLMLPNGLDRVEMNATLTEQSRKDLCSAWAEAKRDKSSNVRDKVSLTLRLYMNQPDEDRESGRMTVVMNLADSCSGSGVTKQPLSIVVNRPYSGTWRMSVELGTIGQDGKPEKLPSEHVRKSVLVLSVVARYSSCPSGFSGQGEMVQVQGYELTEGKYAPVGPPEQRDCQLPVNPLRSIRSSSRRGGLQLRSSDTRLTRVWQEETGRPSPDADSEAERVSLKHHMRGGASAMFSGSLEHLYLASVVGGLMQIEMRVRPLEAGAWLTPANMKRAQSEKQPLTNDTDTYHALEMQERADKELRGLTTTQLQRRLIDSHFLLSLRVGAVASDATVPITGATAHRAQGGISLLDPLDSFSGDALVLSTRDATVRLLDDASAPVGGRAPRAADGGSEGASTLPLPPFLRVQSPTSRKDQEGAGAERGDASPEVLAGLQYTWTLSKPAIAALTASSLHSLDSLYLRVTKTDPPFKASLGASPGFENFVANVGINLLHCHADSCVHGSCVVREDSDVPHSSCHCDYPYGGERCEQMAVSLPLYLAQVLLLVSSNLAALPGIALSAQQGLFMLAACLLLAATSSAVYHLCDLGVVCPAGLSFASFQVFDVLFCLLTVGVTCLHHSPLGPESVAALSVLLLGAVVPVVVNDATHPMTVITAVLAGAGLLVCTWLNYSARLAVRQAQRQRQRQRQRQKAQRPGQDAEDAGEEGGVELNPLRPSSSSSSLLTGKTNEGEEETEALLSGSGTGSGRATPTPPYSAHPGGPVEARRREEQEDNEAVTSARALFAENKGLAARLRHLAGELRHTLAAGAIALAGLAAFLTQTRENYAVTHSVWHVCVMASTYYFVQGRRAVIRNLRGVIHHLQRID